ncbi:MAG: trypsin-like peptidase domain-containing protein [Candidatus Schekmanbacteria bacterium]|nr:trypsin-like peptidase domain-containing protein [Candidatus Schekmanbacteria bacterium]
MKAARAWGEAVAALVVLAATAATAAAAADSAAIANARAATVRIITGEVDEHGAFRGQGSGSGVVITPSGLVLTNHHVVFGAGGRPGAEIWAGVSDPARPWAAPAQATKLRLVGFDAALDLALLRALAPAEGSARPFAYLRLGRMSGLSFGSRVTLIAYPTDGTPTATVLESAIVAIDDENGWIAVADALGEGASGGAVIDEEGDLVGAPTRVRADSQVPFLGDGDLPIGTLTLGRVGEARSIGAIREFLGRLAAEHPEAGTAAITPPSASESGAVRVTGTVVDEVSKAPIPGAVVGFLRPGPASAAGTVRERDLMAYARSGFHGELTLNRRLVPGRYLVKVVHPQYRTVLEKIEVGAVQDFQIELKREE